MTHPSEDDRIRDGFLDLRAHVERAAIPDFDDMLARAHAEADPAPDLRLVRGDGGLDRTRIRLTRIGGWMSLAAAATAAGILLMQPPPVEADAEFESLVTAFALDAATGAWRSPTSSLMEIPGLDLATIPSVGRFMPGDGAIRPPDGNETQRRDS